MKKPGPAGRATGQGPAQPRFRRRERGQRESSSWPLGRSTSKDDATGMVNE